MLCPSCQADVVADAKFCHRCGTILQPEAFAPQAFTEPQTAVERFRQAVASRQDQGDNDTESDLWTGNYSSKAMFGAWIVAGLITIAGIILAAIAYPSSGAGWLWTLGLIILLWLGLYLWLLYRQFSVFYQLTNQRLVHKRGILSRTTDRIEVIDMDDVTYTQGPIQRILGVGTILITSSDRTHPEIILPGIDRVADVSRMMDDARRTERRRRGLHIESV
ncbi:MAG: PH domain-containing protein [Pirellulales bacterium]|nr:PH domain-containing protein [Pirellulales bacterium]